MLKVKILSPEKLFFEGRAKSVSLPSVNGGSFAIFPKHAPIISVLGAGRLVLLDAENTERVFNIDGGFIDVSDDQMVILIN
ncbi:MAG: FoF1 ATP synthase subunit delta/epsilon [Bacteroidales bacterium]